MRPTPLKKLDRSGAVRCECKVTETGFLYKGQEFRSLSAAAMAAAKDLNISGAQNGYLSWSLIKQQPRVSDPVEALEAAWERFHQRATGVFATAKDDEAALAKLKTRIRRADEEAGAAHGRQIGRREATGQGAGCSLRAPFGAFGVGWSCRREPAGPHGPVGAPLVRRPLPPTRLHSGGIPSRLSIVVPSWHASATAAPSR